MTKRFFVICLFAAALATPVQAASQDECSIWLCLPGGFPSGCGGALSAMKDRIEKFKPPLPPFVSCAVNPPSGSGNHMSSGYGVAAFVPVQRVCRNELPWGECRDWEIRRNQYIKGTRCRHTHEGSIPRGCSATYHYAEVYIEGQLAGPTFYW